MEMMSQQLDKIFAALSKAQQEMKVAPKDSDNPFFKSKYADLQTVWETIKAPLCHNELSVSQLLNESGENLQLVTILGHSSGQWLKSVSVIKLKPIRMNKNGEIFETNLNAQEIASAVTYTRRMALSAITGCYAGEADDDGEEAVGRKPEAKGHYQPAPQPIEKIDTEQFNKINSLMDARPDLEIKLMKSLEIASWNSLPRSKYEPVLRAVEKYDANLKEGK